MKLTTSISFVNVLAIHLFLYFVISRLEKRTEIFLVTAGKRNKYQKQKFINGATVDITYIAGSKWLRSIESVL